nr:immunoglobulin light chain junction region [Macaca mulatta]MOW36194.1 immunoglobulin light chain junction region [Macaca mulatta]MOW36340.1 immunoglobulin light chain junction region [Macaca mulatta]MOW36536.1 immunoglobulin light chain junction region [Macaca mulatta]MOW36646.1 immunoglobulin light chain junction region [Macaca mulatta]
DYYCQSADSSGNPVVF